MSVVSVGSTVSVVVMVVWNSDTVKMCGVHQDNFWSECGQLTCMRSLVLEEISFEGNAGATANATNEGFLLPERQFLIIHQHPTHFYIWDWGTEMDRSLSKILQPLPSGAKTWLGSPSAWLGARSVELHRGVSSERYKGSGLALSSSRLPLS